MARHRTRLRAMVRRRVVWRGDEALEEALQEATLMIYGMMEKGIRVRHPQAYFCSTAIRLHGRTGVGPEALDEETPHFTPDRSRLADSIRETIAGAYGEKAASLFMDYMMRKAEDERCSYRSYAEMKGLPLHRVMTTVKVVRRFLLKKEEERRKKRQEDSEQWDG